MTFLFLVLITAGVDADSASADARRSETLGDTCVAQGKLPDALAAYERSSHLRGQQDPGTLKKVAQVQEWMRQYGAARATLGRAHTLGPEDGDVQSSLAALDRGRSLHLIGSAGGWEVDYTRNVQEYGAFVGWADWADLYAGYAQTDRVFYRRTNTWADAYLFPDYKTSIRIGGRFKRYEYPGDINPHPDASAYDHAVHLQVEGAYSYGVDNAVSLELEYFRPNFFWNRGLFANNLKIEAALRTTIAGPLYGRLFAALLRDPDPLSMTTDPSGTLTSFGYETVWLAGAGLGYDDGTLSGEVRYVPDRDLDRSLQWSLFARLGYRFGRYGIQADLLYDRYPDTGSRGFSGSRVSMLTLLAEPWDALELRVGGKLLTRVTTEVAPFVMMRVKTGI